VTFQTLDLTRPIRTRPERDELVNAVYSALRSEPEKDWIEWKSTYDLNKAEGQCKLARHIIGFANRHPDKASSTFGGCAYLLCGVEPGDVQGVAVVDPADLVQGIGRYTGMADGPRWDIDYVYFMSRHILVITVEPPEWGDRIHTLRKAYDKFVEGSVYIRRAGQTVQATTSEVQMLAERFSRQKRRVELDVQWASRPADIVRLVVDKNQLDSYVLAEKKALLDHLENQGGDRSTLWFQTGLAENRTPDAYRKEVDYYIGHLRDRLLYQGILRAIRRGTQAQLVVVNNSDRNFTAVRVEAHLDGPVQAYWDEQDAADELKVQDLPGRPRPYGSPRDLSSLIRPTFTMPRLHWPTYGGHIDNRSSAHVRFDDVDVRPYNSVHLNPFRVIALGAPVPETLAVDWEVTAKNTDGRQTGRLLLPVGTSVVGLDDILRKSAANSTDEDSDELG
jgi:Schlafen, AlbA_2